MVKKISAIILAFVLCLSAMIVPTMAAELADGMNIAFELKWDKDAYEPGETATLSVYMNASEALQLGTGSFIIGLNSAQIAQADNSVDDIKAKAVGSDLWNSFWKEPANATVSWLTSAIVSKVQAQNTDEENALYDQYMKIVIARNTSSGWHENASDLKYGLPGADINALEEPIITFSYVVSADIESGTKLNAAITSGSTTCSPAQTAFKYIKAPGASTTANVAATTFDLSAAVATATVKVNLCENGHTPAEEVQENVENATCGTDGSYYAVVYCSVCGEEISRTLTTVPATGEHVYAKEINRVEPTCTEDGYVVKACGCSDNVNITETLPATGHSETKVVTKPTCTEAGYTTYTCSVCGETRTADEVPAKGHSYRDKVTAPTCTEAGYTTHTCPICKDSYTDTEVPAIGHKYETAVTAPTCTEAGYTTYTCSACGDTYTADEVAATGHKHEVTAVKQPTCSKAGFTRYTCACGDSYDVEIPSTNHTNADGTSALVEIPAVPATCKTPGYTAGEKCTLCNTQTIVPQQVPTSDHAWDAGVVTAPTYTAEGYTTYTCTVCGETKNDDFVPALTPDTPDTPDVPSTGLSFEIRDPAVTKLRFMDEMLLHADVANAPEGSYVKWEATEGAEFFTIMEDNGDGKLRITPKDEGWTTFKATLYDVNGNVLATDEIEMFSRAHLFDKIGGIIRYIFGSNIKYEK